MFIKSFGLLISLTTVLLPLSASATDQVWIHVNYPDDVVYTDAINVVEIWIENSQPLCGMTLPFGFSSSSGTLSWVSPYGTYPRTSPYVQVDDPLSIDTWGVSGWMVQTSGLPHQILIGGAIVQPEWTFHSHATATRILSMKLDGSTLTAGGQFCANNIFIPPAGTWTFDNCSGGYPPEFYPCLDCPPETPDVCFPIAARSWLGGDADGNQLVSISDAVYLLNYVFAGGPAPFPIRAGDANCDEHINISDCVFLIAYIFAGGAAPC